jgi:hypothetical protein
LELTDLATLGHMLFEISSGAGVEQVHCMERKHLHQLV